MNDLQQVPPPSVGLVLSGGGAKGAYQVGVLKALNELNIQVDAVAGASIGSLNGAIIAAADNQLQAAEHLENLWTELSTLSPVALGSVGSLPIKLPAYLSMLGGFGLNIPMLQTLAAALAKGSELGKLPWIPDTAKRLANLAKHLSASGDSLLCDQRIKSLIDRYLSEDGLPARIPLHVSVYPTQGFGIDLMRIVGSMFSVSTTRDSHFLHIQALARTEQKEALLASAALPLLYAPREVNGQLYTDGGQGGWNTVQGNTPIEPLLQSGCRQVIVTHLSDGSFWNRSQFPDATVIEIRPKTSSIARSKSAVSDLFGFDNTRIPSWIRQGYEDTHACVGPIMKTLNAFGELRVSEAARDHAVSSSGEDTLKRAMQRLQSH